MVERVSGGIAVQVSQIPVSRFLVQSSERWTGRFCITFVAMLAGLGGYLLVNGRVPPRLDLLTPVDSAIPFIPASIVLYHSYYVLPLAAAVGCTPPEFLRMLRAAFPVCLVTFACFLLMPAEITRPSWESAGAFWGPAFRFLHGADGTGNTFPSFHVAITVLAWTRTRHWRGSAFWTGWALLVVLSTLTTKQHFIADVASGTLLAIVADAWAGRTTFLAPPA